MGIIERISEAEAVRDISGLLDRVRTQGASIEIMRGDEVVARVTPAAASEAETSPRPGTFEALLQALNKVPAASPDESAAWERELAELRRQLPVQVREWD